LACAGNKAKTDENPQPDQAGAARDTTSGTENPPGYRGMERDTTIAPTGQQPSDTFLQKQGTGQAQDTAGYSGMERVDTTGRANPSGQADSTGSGMNRTDSTGASGAAGMDSTGMSKSGDTTGYQPSQQTQDTTTSR
jgi:hypothetical protein